MPQICIFSLILTSQPTFFYYPTHTFEEFYSTQIIIYIKNEVIFHAQAGKKKEH
jgi:hypothetical protein